MKLSKEVVRLYAVTDSKYLNGRKLSELVEEAIHGGATIIQLREKNVSYDAQKEVALEVQKVCHQYNVPFIINDDVKLCLDINADGVHLGQDDGDIVEARKQLGEDKIIGVSAHNLEEALKAKADGADYLGVGAIFTTGTKSNVVATSYETLKDICNTVDLPVVAIGGIDQTNMLQLVGSGIAGIAVVSSIFGSDAIQKDTQELKARIDRLVNQTMPTALTIAGSDCSGGAGIQADLKTMIANRVYGMSVLTALTAQNTTGVTDIMNVTPEFLSNQLDAIFTDIYPQAIKIGMVSDSELIKTISMNLKKYNARNIVVDPVMVATSGAKLISDEAIDTLKTELLPLSTVITPNIPEAMVLCDVEIKDEETMLQAAKVISENYHCSVLLKGGHSINDANDLLYADGHATWFKGRRIANSNTHGTGCTLSSAIASNLSKGYDLIQSVHNAKEYISGALEAMLDLGNGQGPMDHGHVLDKK